MQGQQGKLWKRGIFALSMFAPGCGDGSFSKPGNDDQSSTPTLGESVVDQPADNAEDGIADFPQQSSDLTRLIVKFRKGTGANKRSAILKASGDHAEMIVPQLDMYVIPVPPGQTAEQVIERYANQSLVEFAERELFAEPTAVIPNDPWFPNWQEPTFL